MLYFSAFFECVIKKGHGCYKNIFLPDCGDHVVVINAEKVVFTGNKWKDKLYRWHTGFPGGLKERTATQVLDKDPSKILKSAVHGMLPKNKMRKVQNKKLHVFAGNEHSFKKELEGCTSIV